MLIFHPDVSPLPEPAPKREAPAIPSSPKDAIPRGGTVLPGTHWMPLGSHLGTGGEGDGGAKRAPCSLLRSPFAGCSHLVAGTAGCRGGRRAPVTWLSPESHPSCWLLQSSPPPARLALVQRGCFVPPLPGRSWDVPDPAPHPLPLSPGSCPAIRESETARAVM